MTNISPFAFPRAKSNGHSPKTPGAFVISLDFELHWGVRDLMSIAAYRKNLLGERNVVPRLLQLFSGYQIHATWATVGFLFFDSRTALIEGCPTHLPRYRNSRLSPYHSLDRIGQTERDDPYHFAPSLIARIASVPHQEIATHTFSHYFCLADGQNADHFRADLAAAIRVARSFGVALQSIVFPRNQVNPAYLPICRELGLTAYRGTPQRWMYRIDIPDTTARRAARLLDAYVNLSGHNGHRAVPADGGMFNVPASRFLRPYSRALPAINQLQLQRIRSDLSYAAQHGLSYHLWWHPHNIGVNSTENLSMLAAIFDHFGELKRLYGMESLTMCEMAERGGARA